jgi:hypothetical protein
MQHQVRIEFDIKIKSDVKGIPGIGGVQVGNVAVVDTSVKAEFNFFRIQYISKQQGNQYLTMCTKGQRCRKTSSCFSNVNV